MTFTMSRGAAMLPFRLIPDAYTRPVLKNTESDFLRDSKKRRGHSHFPRQKPARTSFWRTRAPILSRSFWWGS